MENSTSEASNYPVSTAQPDCSRKQLGGPACTSLPHPNKGSLDCNANFLGLATRVAAEMGSECCKGPGACRQARARSNYYSRYIWSWAAFFFYKPAKWEAQEDTTKDHRCRPLTSLSYQARVRATETNGLLCWRLFRATPTFAT